MSTGGSIASRAIPVVAVVALIAGCGDDEGDGAPPPAQPARPTAAATPGAPAGAAGNKNLLAEKPHIEDRVSCSIPEQPSDPRDGKCDPKAPSCGEHLYCLQLAQGYFCEPCPERDGIRHVFRERDFDAEHNRDPFQSVLTPIGPQPPGPAGLTKKCPREDQLVATSYSYSDLKLVGIVAQGTQRKVLMITGKTGYIIKRGDCVGKEKAYVKDIGTGYITFQLDPDEYSVQLNPKQLMVNEPELSIPAPRTTVAPVAPARPGAGSAAAPVPPPPAGAAARPAAGSVTPGSAAGSAAPAIEAPPAAARKP